MNHTGWRFFHSDTASEATGPVGTCRDQGGLPAQALLPHRHPAPRELKTPCSFRNRTLRALSVQGPVDHRPAPCRRVHPLLAVQHGFLHSHLAQELGCSMLTTAAFSNLKLLPQTCPLAAVGNPFGQAEQLRKRQR